MKSSVISFLALLIFTLPSYAQIEMSPWYMHKGKGVIPLAGTGVDLKGRHGNPVAYQLAEIPSFDVDTGWEPIEGEVNMRLDTDPALKDCYQAVDFTYFVAEVYIPEGTEITSFNVKIGYVDDGARMYIFNEKHPNGQFDPATDGRLYGRDFMVDFTQDAAIYGNVIVIIQMDDCPVRNWLTKGVTVEVNGKVIQPDTEFFEEHDKEVDIDGNPEKKGLAKGYYAVFNGDKSNYNLLTADPRYENGVAFAGPPGDDGLGQGQTWLIEEAKDGYYRLKNENGDKCLESHQASLPQFGGASHLDACQNVTGQYWKIIPNENGSYRLKSQFRGDGECLEFSKEDGKFYMKPCGNKETQEFHFDFYAPAE